ncbi:hypothetical protein OGZ01_20065 [Vibrio harveyi]|nr:hypothetical protein [Vibrio harveyi]
MKIASADWADATNFGGDGSVELGKAITMNAGGGSKNLKITIAEAGNYNFPLQCGRQGGTNRNGN